MGLKRVPLLDDPSIDGSAPSKRLKQHDENNAAGGGPQFAAQQHASFAAQQQHAPFGGQQHASFAAQQHPSFAAPPHAPMVSAAFAAQAHAAAAQRNAALAAAAGGPICPICRDPWVARCAVCLSGKYLYAECTLAFGACGCAFHDHCLQPWLARRPVCPVHECAWQPVAPRLPLGDAMY